MELYRDSILMEIKECDHMLYTMFRQADLHFPEESVMELVLEDSVIAKSKEDELVGILDKVLNERCGFQVKFQTAYKEAAASKYKEDDALRIRRIVEVISSRFGGNAEAVFCRDAKRHAKRYAQLHATKMPQSTSPAAEKPKSAAAAKQKPRQRRRQAVMRRNRQNPVPGRQAC